MLSSMRFRRQSPEADQRAHGQHKNSSRVETAGQPTARHQYPRTSARENRRPSEPEKHQTRRKPPYLTLRFGARCPKSHRVVVIQVAAPSDPTQDAEAAGSSPGAPASPTFSRASSSSSEEEDGDEAPVVTCTVCLAAYEEDEVVSTIASASAYSSRTGRICISTL